MSDSKGVEASLASLVNNLATLILLPKPDDPVQVPTPLTDAEKTSLVTAVSNFTRIDLTSALSELQTAINGIRGARGMPDCTAPGSAPGGIFLVRPRLHDMWIHVLQSDTFVPQTVPGGTAAPLVAPLTPDQLLWFMQKEEELDREYLRFFPALAMFDTGGDSSALNGVFDFSQKVKGVEYTDGTALKGALTARTIDRHDIEVAHFLAETGLQDLALSRPAFEAACTAAGADPAKWLLVFDAFHNRTVSLWDWLIQSFNDEMTPLIGKGEDLARARRHF